MEECGSVQERGSEVVQAEIQKRTEEEKVQGENKVEETEKVFVDEQKKRKNYRGRERSVQKRKKGGVIS